ncbi:MAG: ParA family partition ATPase [Alphaproteobacteria bacterium]
MAGRIVTVAQRKGGSGKTTLAANLAAAWSVSGWTVAAIDIDPQRSLSLWSELRDAHGGKGIAVGSVPGYRVRAEADALARRHDVVLIDAPPHDETEARIAIRAADLVLVPVQPSPMDVWATRQTLDLVAAEGRRVLLVLNRVPPRARLTEAMHARLVELGAPIASTRIGNRVALASALAEGQAAAEREPGGAAAREIAALAAEVRANLQDITKS